MTQGPGLPVPESDTLRAWLLEALHAEGVADARIDGDALVLANGLGIDAEAGLAERNARGHVRTVTRTLAWHADCPDGLMEYQHSVGDDVRAAIIAGFRQWARLDLEAIVDALPGSAQRCLHLDFALPAAGGDPARLRRVVLGSPARFARNREDDADDEHPFCPCCMFTNAMDAFQPLLDADEVLGLRLYAARNEDGSIDADCRVNGEDFPPGVEALRAYAATWPGRSFEFRKQYAVVCTPSAGDSADAELP